MMNKIEFLERLEEKLRGINVVDRVRSLDYFSEMIDDSVENGMSEDEAVAALGDIDDIAAQIKNEAPASPLKQNRAFENAEKPEQAAPLDSEFSSIRIRVRESDVCVFIAEDGECRVDCTDFERYYHRVFCESGVLKVEVVDERRWFDRFNRMFGTSPKVNIYLPAGEYDSLDVETMSGDIEIPKGLSFENMRLKSLSGDVELFCAVHGRLELSSTSGDVCAEGENELSYMKLLSISGDLKARGFSSNGEASVCSTSGDIEAADIGCESGVFKSISGDLRLKGVIASAKLSISSTSGDVRFDGCDGASVELGSISGDIKGILLTGKRFTAKSLSGSIRLPKDNPNPNGECSAKTVSGSINLSICE